VDVTFTDCPSGPDDTELESVSYRRVAHAKHRNPCEIVGIAEGSIGLKLSLKCHSSGPVSRLASVAVAEMSARTRCGCDEKSGRVPWVMCPATDIYRRIGHDACPS
jgi:hypothetical protein